MAGDVIDIFSKTKFKKDSPSYNQRFIKCYNESKNNQSGLCECDICIEKRHIAYEVISLANTKCINYMKETGTPLYFDDLLEVLIIAAKHTRNYIDGDRDG